MARAYAFTALRAATSTACSSSCKLAGNAAAAVVDSCTGADGFAGVADGDALAGAADF